MPKIEAELKPEPGEWSLIGCQEYLMGLAVPCPASGWRDDMGRHSSDGGRCTTCGGTGKVYPLRERYGPAWHRQPCPTPATCDCRGIEFVPVEPHLETLRAAALQAGYEHRAETRWSSERYWHMFRRRGQNPQWVYGADDLLTAYRALCLAQQKEVSDE